MLVTKIQEKTRNRVEVVLDQEFSFVLYKGELRSYKITLNNEIPSTSYHEIMKEVLPKRAKLRAMNLLKVRPYTESGLRQKLAEGGYPQKIIDIAIDYVASFHYIDDSQYAADYIDTYKDRKSKKCIIRDLSLKGVSKDIIQKAFEDFEDSEEGNADFEKEQVRAILKKKNYSSDWPYEEKMKLMAYLYRKGYSVDIDRILGDIDLS